MTDLVSNIIKFNAQTNGRDKLCRLFQYSCRLAWGVLQDKDRKDLLTKLKNIESMLSMTRKLLRFGKSVDFIQGALNSLHLKDEFLRLTLTLAKINQACYMLFDHFLWFNNVGAVKLDKQYWSEISSRFYLATLVLNLMRDVYDIYCIYVREMKVRKSRKTSSEYKNGDTNHKSVSRRETTLIEILLQNVPLVIDTVKNVFDLAIPLSTLGIVKMSAKAQGVFGVTSSFLALITVWNANLKLVPS